MSVLHSGPSRSGCLRSTPCGLRRTLCSTPGLSSSTPSPDPAAAAVAGQPGLAAERC